MQKKEKLDDLVLTKLRELQTTANDCVLGLGEIELRLREVTTELQTTSQAKKDVIEMYDAALEGIKEELK